MNVSQSLADRIANKLRKENCHLTNGDEMTPLYCQLGQLEGLSLSRRCDRTLAGVLRRDAVSDGQERVLLGRSPQRPRTD